MTPEVFDVEVRDWDGRRMTATDLRVRDVQCHSSTDKCYDRTGYILLAAPVRRCEGLELRAPPPEYPWTSQNSITDTCVEKRIGGWK